MKTNKIKFVANVVRWFDKANGNTYHSVNVTRVKDGQKVCFPFQYGYEEAYKQTALFGLLKLKMLPEKYDEKNYYLYERENNYPIMWNVTDGLKRDCVANGKP